MRRRSLSVILVGPSDQERGGEVVIQSWDAVAPSNVRLPNGQVVFDTKAGDRVDGYEFRAVTAKSPVQGRSFLTRDLLALLSLEDRIAIDRLSAPVMRLDSNGLQDKAPKL